MKSCFLPLLVGAAVAAAEPAPSSLIRYVVIDNVCAWPNLTLLADSRIVTAHYSQSVENHHRYHMGVVIWEAPRP